jgi:hypothetical protein
MTWRMAAKRGAVRQVLRLNRVRWVSAFQKPYTISAE